MEIKGWESKINPRRALTIPKANFHPQLSNSFLFEIEKTISEIPLIRNEMLKSNERVK